ncbi:MAG: 2,3-bisphosphoglycerate-independent phosphoglycerate mutase [Candidatus Geothermarchaeales archaeon]
MKPRKILVTVGDGMADRAVKDLGWRSPLEVAETPNIDLLARRGVLGVHVPLKSGVRVESEDANLSIMGYDPSKIRIRRGPIEALGRGIRLERGEIAFRTNFATVENGILVDRRAGRFNWDPKPLEEALNKIKVRGAEVKYYHSLEHRGIIVMRSKTPLSPHVSDTDPHAVGVPPIKSKPIQESGPALRTAKILNEYIEEAEKSLDKLPLNREREEQGLLPANTLITRGAGTLPDIPSFTEEYGLRGAVICGMPMIKGLARIVGLEAPDVEGATGRTDTNFDGKTEAAIKALEEFDYVYVHVKAMDSASHDGNVELKVRMIERFDGLVGKILEASPKDEVVVCITADHVTPVRLGEHRGDPVPFLVWFSEIIGDEATRFSEREAYKGGFHRIRANELMSILLEYAR